MMTLGPGGWRVMPEPEGELLDALARLHAAPVPDGTPVHYRDVYHQNEVEQSTYNFEHANVDLLFTFFNSYEAEAKRMIEAQIALPAYELVLKAGHTFNLLDARGAISVTERAAYIGRIRALSRLVAQAYYESREKLGFPMLGNPVHGVPGLTTDEQDAAKQIGNTRLNSSHVRTSRMPSSA